MKEHYEALDMEVIEFEAEDIVTSSPCGDDIPGENTRPGDM